MKRLFVNGKAGTTIDALDRGLQYGDGLFETIAVSGCRPRFLDWHLERLDDGARRLGFPALDLNGLRSEILEAIIEPKAVVKLILTRGMGPRGYRPPRDAKPSRIVAAFDWPVFSASAESEGVRVGWCRTRLGRNTSLAGLKHLNRLEQVLARAEWEDGAMDEGLMQDDRGRVIAATQANLFVRMAEQWVTPVLDECGVAGVMRRAFRHWAAGRGEAIAERPIVVAELEGATSLILTNALIGAWPVRELAGRKFAVDPIAEEFNAWLARA
jgi:4-amino-4-deoxychorismate lyase